MDISYLSHILPKGLLDHFSITDFKELCSLKNKSTFYQFHLEEHNVILGDYDANLYESKGFTKITLQDFPIRGRAVYLVFKRRRWRLKSDKKIIQRNDFSFIAAGSGFTQELSDFLKGINRYPRGHHKQHR